MEFLPLTLIPPQGKIIKVPRCPLVYFVYFNCIVNTFTFVIKIYYYVMRFWLIKLPAKIKKFKSLKN